MQAIGDIAAAIRKACEDDPEYISRPLSKLNAEAVACYKAGNHVAAIAAFAKLFERARVKNLVHAELHVCHRCAPCTQPAIDRSAFPAR